MNEADWNEHLQLCLHLKNKRIVDVDPIESVITLSDGTKVHLYCGRDHHFHPQDTGGNEIYLSRSPR